MDYGRLSISDDLASRITSGFPLSIGTAMAMESIFDPRGSVYDPSREVPQRIDLGQYQDIWINLSTLFRNMVGSVKKEAIVTCDEKDFADTILEEIETIDSLFQNEGLATCKPQYYYCTYKEAKSTDPRIKMRVDKTDGQLFYRHKHDKVLEMLGKSSDSISRFDSYVMPFHRSSALILTHVPWDLLSWEKFSRLDLLESNTGRLKGRELWYSKYHSVGDADLSKLPFMRKLLYIFGDKVMIQPFDIRLRREILQIAEKQRWTTMTTDRKVRLDLETMIAEAYVAHFVAKL